LNISHIKRREYTGSLLGFIARFMGHILLVDDRYNGVMKSLHTPINWRRNVVIRTGIINGITILKNNRSAVAPSITAASFISTGIELTKLLIVKMQNGIILLTNAIITPIYNNQIIFSYESHSHTAKEINEH